MSDSKAFIIDTNFIIQNQNLDQALDKLKDQFSIYITQVSIDERIAQQCRELKAQFDEAEKCKMRFCHFANVTFKKSYEEVSESYQKGIQKKYESYFGNHIIPFKKDGKMFSSIIERCNKRLPPFIADKGASDKGFKDCLLWLSILDFFKDNGENKVVFITDDKNAFRNNVEFLQSEFYEATKKTIEIHPNTYYKELLKQPEKPEVVPSEVPEQLPNLDDFREEVEKSIECLRGVDWENYFGNPQWTQTFTTSVPFDKEYIKKFFEGLNAVILEHILEKKVPASKVLDFDGRITDLDAEIPISSLEQALRIYQTVLYHYPQYRDQFFEAAAKILNYNYKALPTYTLIEDDDDLPF